MTDARFEQCLPYILQEEGGNDDDPNDHGGRTSRGITQREYDAWRKARGLATRDVWTAVTQEIHDIYYENYWLPICPKLAPGVDLMFFNIAVNGGTRRAAVILQRSLSVPEDGQVGPVTLEHAAQANPTKLINDFDQHVIGFYRSLAQFSRYGKGWLSREARIRVAALKAAPTTTPQPAPIQTQTQTQTPAPAPIITQETLPMPTTTAVPTAQIPTIQIPHIDFATIEKLIESVSFLLPIIATFVPQAKPLLALLPMLEQGLKAADDIQHTVANGGDIWSVIASHLHTIADQVKAAPAAMNAATPGAPTNGMPNS